VGAAVVLATAIAALFLPAGRSARQSAPVDQRQREQVLAPALHAVE
jgi:hypothetical protein